MFVISALLFAFAMPLWASAQTTCIEADFNGDGWIGSSDLLEFLSYYGGEVPEECFAIDFNGDGAIGSYDLLEFLALYGGAWQDASADIGCGGVAFEGHTYSTVVIGNQCWFAENCRYLPEVSPNASTSFEEPVYYVFGYEGDDVEDAKATENYNLYGTLYNWQAVQGSEVCPNGWHVSSDEDWKELEITLGMDSSVADSEGWRGTDQGMQMKSTSGWSNDGNGTNTSGLNVQPGGWRYAYGGFYHLGDDAVFWTTSLAFSSDNYAWYRALFHDQLGVQRENPLINSGFSARCVQD
jgi:uncharacterized protein (TIGR02145 family)